MIPSKNALYRRFDSVVRLFLFIGLAPGLLASCFNSSDDAADSAAESADESVPAQIGGGTPQYPGLAVGCSWGDADEPVYRNCTTFVAPEDYYLTGDINALCDEGDTVHPGGCPSPLNSETGAIAFTCQEHEDPAPGTSFSPYEVHMEYQNYFVENAKAFGANAVSKCEESIRRENIPGVECPADSVIKYYSLDSTDCSKVKP